MSINQPRVEFDGIAIENRLHAEVNWRTEVRGRTLVIIIEPGKTVKPGLILPNTIVMPGGSNGNT